MRSIFVGCVLASLLGGNLAMSPVAQATGAQVIPAARGSTLKALALNAMINNIKNRRDVCSVGNVNTSVDYLLKALASNFGNFKSNIDGLIADIGTNPLDIFKQLNTLKKWRDDHGDRDSYVRMCQEDRRRLQFGTVNTDASGVIDAEFPDFVEKCIKGLEHIIEDMKGISDEIGVPLLAIQWEANTVRNLSALPFDEKALEKIFFVRNLFIALAVKFDKDFNELVSDGEWMLRRLGVELGDESCQVNEEDLKKVHNGFTTGLVEVFLDIPSNYVNKLIKEDRIEDFIAYIHQQVDSYDNFNKRSKNQKLVFDCLKNSKIRTDPDGSFGISYLDLSILYNSKRILNKITSTEEIEENSENIKDVYGNVIRLNWEHSPFWMLGNDPEVIQLFEDQCYSPFRLSDDAYTIPDEYVTSAAQAGNVGIVEYLVNQYMVGTTPHDFYLAHGFTTLAAEKYSQSKQPEAF